MCPSQGVSLVWFATYSRPDLFSMGKDIFTDIFTKEGLV